MVAFDAIYRRHAAQVIMPLCLSSAQHIMPLRTSCRSAHHVAPHIMSLRTS